MEPARLAHMARQSGDAIDQASDTLAKLLPDINRWLPTICTEEDTRLKIVDPLFIHVLGWNPANIHTEDPTGDGFIDYKLTIDGRARLIVETKKDSQSLGLTNRIPGKAYKLSGPVLSATPQPRGGILQAIRYCGAKNAELACVTNGHEWVIFRGSRLGDGHDTLDGMAFVFPDIQSIRDNFVLFFDLLSYQQVGRYVYRAHFQEAEGQPIRTRTFSRTLRAVDSYHLIPRSNLAHDVDKIMTAFFRKISGDEDPEMLAQCFVTTRESQIADEKLLRIADELAAKVRDLDTSEAKALEQVIRRTRETQRNEFVLIIGTKGAGKSTFIDRFFRNVLSEDLRAQCVVVRLDVGTSPGDLSTIVPWLNRNLLESMERALFEQAGPSFDELQGMYFDEYKRWMLGPHKHLYETDKLGFKTQFGSHIDQRREQRPEEYIQRMIHHVVCSRRRVPCLVFDNTDHFSIEFQERVFQYARSLYETGMCLVVIPITDRTSWQLSQQGALQSFDNEAFFLPTPQPKVVIERRIAFLEAMLLNEKKQKGTGYFLGKGIYLSLNDLNAFTACLQQVFLKTGWVSTWIGNLANNDIRRCLHLSRTVVVSPYLRVDDLFKAYIAKSSCRSSELDIMRAIIRNAYDIYPTGQNEFVQNVFALSTEIESSPLLGLRILRLLRDAKHHEAGGLENYVTVEQSLEYLQAIGIERRAVLLCLDVMLKTGLCFSYDPTVRDIEKTKRIQLSPSGFQHLTWGSYDETYLISMLQVTPIIDEATYQTLQTTVNSKANDPNWWRRAVIVFLKHMLKEDVAYTHDIDHVAYEGQRRLVRMLANKIERLEGAMGRTADWAAKAEFDNAE